MYKTFQGDCVDITKNQIENESIDLILTSPPYDKLRDYEGYNFDFESLAHAIYDVLKENSVLVWVVNDSTKNFNESNTSFNQALYFKNEVGFKLLDTMIYVKKQGPPIYPNCRRYRQAFEYMFVFVKGHKPKSFNKQKKKRKTNKDGYSTFRQKDGSLKRKEINSSKKDKKALSNVWQLNVGKGHSAEEEVSYEHPAIFPEELAERHIKTWTDKNDIVYDPMCGSGTTLKMAIKNNRRAIGCDTSEKYIEITERRINEFKENQ